MRIVSVSSALFDGYDLAVALDTISASSATYVEPAFIRGYLEFDETAFDEWSARHWQTRIAAAHLDVQAVSAHMDLGTASSLPTIARRIRFAGMLGARFLITNAGQANCENIILRSIEGVLPLCEQCNVVLALENPGHGTGDLIGTGAMGSALVERFDSAYLRLNHDAGNLYTYSKGQRQPAQDLAECCDAVAHAHLKDVGEQDGGWTFSAIGEGVIDYEAYWRALPADLPLSIELPLRLRRPARAAPQRATDRVALAEIRSALERSLAYVRCREAG